MSAVGLEFAPLAEGRVSRARRDRRGSARGASADRARCRRWSRFVKDAHSVAGPAARRRARACEGADVIVTNELALLLGWQASEHFGAQLVRVAPVPAAADGAAGRRPRRAPDGVAGDAPLARRGPTRGRPAAASAARAARSARRPADARAARVQPGGRPGGAAAGASTHVTGYWFLESDVDPEPPRGARAVPRGGPGPRLHRLRQHDRRRPARA